MNAIHIPGIRIIDVSKIFGDLLNYTASIEGKIYPSEHYGQPKDLTDFKDSYLSVGYYVKEPTSDGQLILDVFKPIASCQARHDHSGIAWAEYSIFMCSRTDDAPFLTEELAIMGTYKGAWSQPLGGGGVSILPKEQLDSFRFRLANRETKVIDMILHPNRLT